MEIHLNGEPFIPDGKNMALYHYSGELACFTHIFCEQNRDLELKRVYGGFVWCDEAAFLPLHEFLVENEYPLHLNQKEIKQSEIDQWHEKHAHDLDNFNTLEDLDGSPTPE